MADESDVKHFACEEVEYCSSTGNIGTNEKTMLEIDTIYTVHIFLAPNGLQTKFTYVVYLNFPHFQEKLVAINLVSRLIIFINLI